MNTKRVIKETNDVWLDEYIFYIPGEVASAIPPEAAIATAAALVGVGIFSRFFTKAAKACKKLPSKQKTICMFEYKIKGYQLQISTLKKYIPQCRKDKNPLECKAKILEKIEKIERKILVVRSQLQDYKQKYGMMEQFDPITAPIIAGAGIATGVGLHVARAIAAKKKRKQCIKWAMTIQDPQEKRKALVRCYQAGD